MQTRQPYRFLLELRKGDNSSLGQVPVEADWEPAWESMRFLAQRRFPRATIGAEAQAELRVTWDEHRGQPYVGALDVVLAVPDAGELSCRLPKHFFKTLATEASRPLVEKGLLQSAERFHYLITAFPAAPPTRRSGKPKDRFQIKEVSAPVPVRPSSLAEFSARSLPAGEQNETDIPVFLPEQILAEADQLTLQAGGVETASVLLGHLHRDRVSGDLFLEVTAQIPTRDSGATATKVSFGPETWNAVHNALALRKGNEQWVGWFHSHPASSWCGSQCSPEDRARCPLQRSFFSAADCDVHRTVFSKGFHIALLVTHTDGGLQHALFSWRNGTIAQRGFHILGNERKPAAAFVAAATIGDEENEKNCP